MTTMIEPSSGRMPALYIGHGAPPLLDDPEWSGQLRALAATLPRPTAILIVSAHWESAPLMLSAAGPNVPLVYDFGGFEPKYYRMTYRTPEATELARRVAAMMPDTERVHQHATRGLDHGAWVPLKIMYPEADIPVLQMSLPTQDPDKLIELGGRLRQLRDEGVRSLLVEGGAQVITSLLGAGLADRIVVGTAPRIIGAGTEAVGDLGVARVTEGIVLRNGSVHLTADDVVTAWDVAQDNRA